MINYIKTKDGEEFPIRFDQEANTLWQDYNEIPYDKLTTMSRNFMTWKPRVFYSLIWTAIQVPCAERNKPFPYNTFESFNKWVSKDDSVLEQAIKYWIESQPKEDPESPKKQQAAKSKSR